MLLAAPEQLAAMGVAGPAWVRNHFSWKEALAGLAALMIEVARP